MISFFKRHTLLSIYTVIFIVLSYGVFETSGWKYFHFLIVFISSFFISYLLINKLISKKSIRIPNLFNRIDLNINLLIGLSLSLIIAHFLFLGYIPILKAISLNEADEIAWVRTNILIDSKTFFNYASSILIRAVLPFVLLFLLTKNKQILFIIFSLIFSFYAFALMQKSFIVTIFLPSAIYSIYNRSYLNFFFSISLIIGTIISIGYITNPTLNPVKTGIVKVPPSQTTKVKESSIFILFQGIKNRIIIVPGKMVSKWFENVPSKLPHLGVNGYRFIAKARGYNHHDYGKELYPIISKKYYDRGLKGTVNVASFMYEYAYFGWKGLILSGVLLALIFSSIEVLFLNNFIIKLAINCYPILILSSSALTISLLSGGWLFSLILYFLFLNQSSLKKTQ